MLFSWSWFTLALLCSHSIIAAGIPTLSYDVSPEDWAAFNITLNGRLRTAIPFARPCFENSDTADGLTDPDACAAVQKVYTDSETRSSRFATYMASQWEGCQSASESCTLDWMNSTNEAAFMPPATCSQGSVSRFYIDVLEASDLQAAFSFSKTTGVPLVVKNTGHDYNGRSSRKGSLGIWTHNLKSIEYKEDFVARGCPSSSATPGVTIGAGVQHGELFSFANVQNITLPGGACSTVGAVGGYLMGGGHSWLSNIYGLAVDRVLEFEVVTPTGEHLLANACQNEDLFFALRGGGGGTFGVLLSSTMKALKQDAYTSVQLTYTSDETTLPKFILFLIENGVKWAEDGWSGQFRPTSQLILAKVGVDVEGAESYMAPVKALAEELGGNMTIQTSFSYLEFHQKHVESDAHSLVDGIPQSASSRLIPAKTLRDHSEELLDAIVELTKSVPISFIFANAPYSYTPDSFLGETSVHPAWRTAVWHVVAGTAWAYDASVSEQEQLYAGLTASVEGLRAISAGSGAYQNEADVHEPNFTDAFWGPNYGRLVDIKRKYDPDRLLDCWHCVDSTESDSAFSCHI